MDDREGDEWDDVFDLAEMKSTFRENLAIAAAAIGTMRAAASAARTDPRGPGEVLYHGAGAILDPQDLLADPRNQAILHGLHERQPAGAAELFRQLSMMVATIASVALTFAPPPPRRGIAEGLLGGLQMLLAAAHMAEAGEGKEGAATGLAYALASEAQQMMRPAHPLAPLVSAFLGSRAMAWLEQPSEIGAPNIQLHEASRTQWSDLFRLEGQIALENTCRWFEEMEPELAKLLLGTLWTMMDLMALVDPAIFVGEHDYHVSRVAGGDMTMSKGQDTHALVVVTSDSFALIGPVLAEALDASEVDATDLLWMAAALCTIAPADAPADGQRPPVARPSCAVFISHRGAEAKAALLEAELARGPGTNFLDCLAVPMGLTNRHFLYSYLARSEAVLLVETPGFAQSAWCRREAWLAGCLARLGAVRCERLASVPEALAWLEAYPRAAAAAGRTAANDTAADGTWGMEPGWAANRLMRDFDYWARKPNFDTLRSAGADTAPFETVFDLFGKGVAPPEWTEEGLAAIDAAIHALRAHVAGATDALGPAALSTALMGALTICETAWLLRDERAYNKMLTRRVSDSLGRTWGRLEASYNGNTARWAERMHHAGCLAVAAAIELCGFGPSARIEREASRLIGPLGLQRRAMVLIDARAPASRDSALEFLALAAEEGMGAIGLVQDAVDPVHERTIDGFALSVLPCVTVHPGMEGEFPRQE